MNSKAKKEQSYGLIEARTAYILLGLCLTLGFLISCSQDKTSSKPSNEQTRTTGIQTQPLSLDDHTTYEKILAKDSLNTDARLKLAAYYYLNKDYNKALYHFLIVHTIDKNNMAALFNLGNINYDLEQNEEAIPYYEKFLAKDKSNYNVRCDLATCYIRLNKYDKAINLLKENIQANYNHLQSHFNLSYALKQSGKITEANEEMNVYQKLKSKQ
ncbi:MAG: tetratricopeptide repeat protein [Bacteroidetes bacterium]|nr:tetratricopeptide repeat protein [Bacteroidota bacterium]